MVVIAAILTLLVCMALMTKFVDYYGDDDDDN